MSKLMPMEEIEQVMSMQTTMKHMEAKARIKAKVLDEAIVLAEDPQTRTIAARIIAYEYSGISTKQITDLIIAEITQQTIKNLATGITTTPETSSIVPVV